MTPCQRPRRRYSDVFRASALAALDANGGNVKRTAREFNIPWPTLAGWTKGRRGKPVDPELRTQKKMELDEVLDEFARRLCGTDIRAKGVNLRDLGITLGITIDKLLLLRGQATSISKSHAATTTADITRLTRDELLALAALHDKLNGVPELPRASDLDNPVCVDDPTEAPEGEQPRS